MLTVKWTDEAKTGLYTLIAFIAEQNPVAAESLMQRIEESVIPVTEHPYLFRTGRVAGTREIVVHPNYIVIYRVLAEHIEVLSVLHARQEYPRAIP
ncbi:Toxin RelE4 [Serratia quinivorans]|jgi:addiction module RelE/StbE family toxin|uniref:Toxin RelE4 n=1 Tax=Serratia quinivorans TaxID=137545 RepID=A0A380A0T2_9GAMM|nr:MULTISPECIES: type II toxin-antitoxin system RelE/ParE family toxin [Serratia]RYM64364.1 addiction module antitoxin [Serratia proteamaculans]CAI1131580.1 Toxin RelE4 [Serratia quinivorans]CAI1871293.1 Toxin RelE4 [Serratia quinivorans]CAI1971819.1 Toxin RelE4 [Serratia quinivorans]SUI72217.1 Toxin RelE4 [Serratia quinivorans]